MKNTVATLVAMKARGEKISMLTAYDYTTARLVGESGVNAILVGDSLGQVILGYSSTIAVTVEDMIHHGAAVVRGAGDAFVVVDMPFMSYQISPEEALRNAGRIMKQTGCGAVKLEGGAEIAPVITKLVAAGIPVMAHIGMMPQHMNQYGGFKMQGKSAPAANRILEDAVAVECAGAFAVVLECIPAGLASRITERLSIPTIGIGAGAACDGQVLVIHDMLGINKGFSPRFLRRYADLYTVMSDAVSQYITDVKSCDFPNGQEQY